MKTALRRSARHKEAPMADDIFETDEQETLEMDEVLEKVISYCA